MADKQPKTSDAASELEAEVDEMMDPRRPDSAGSNEPGEATSAPELADNSEKLPDIDGEASDDDIRGVTEDANVYDESGNASVESASALDKNDDASGEASSSLDDEKTDAAIDEINKSDSDELLATEDDKRSKAPSEPPKKASIFKRWWRHKPARYWTIVVILALIAAAFATPVSRYWLLNHFGVRGEASLTVLDGSTGLPLEGASVNIGGDQAISGKNGEVSLDRVKLGPQTLTIKKFAFAPTTKKTNISFGKNTLGKLALKAVGVQYKIELTDYLSGQPVVGASVTSGEASAVSDVHGLATLTLMPTGGGELKITANASDYNPNSIKISSTESNANIALVPAGKDYFASNVSGQYDIYSTNLDGSSRQQLLAATGNENDNLQLMANSGGNLLALVSIRSNKTDSNGEPLQTLTIINTKTGYTAGINNAERISLVDWVDGSTIVYLSGQSCTSNPTLVCYQLMSYNPTKGASQELAHADSFNGVVAINNRIYYAASDNFQGSSSEFAAINSDGTNSQVLLNQDVYSVYRSSYNQLLLAATGQWYSYNAGGSAPAEINAPSSPISNAYSVSPDGSQAAWVTTRDGQPTLMIYNVSTGASKTALTEPGLMMPIRWVSNNTLIFRVNSDTETADYAFSLSGGQPKKVANVTNASGNYGGVAH